MSEAPREGTSNLSIASAVESLLAENAPVEDTAEPQEVVAETEEVEVEAEAEEPEAEDIVEDDEPEEADEEVEAVEAVAEQPEETYRVRIGDDDVDLTLEELRLGYMRQGDYTRKTQQVAEGRKAAEAELEALTAQRESYANQLAQLETALNQSEPTQEYWDALQAEDPIEYVKQREALRDRRDALAQVQSEQQRVQQEQYQQLQAQTQERLKQEAEKLLDVIPEWRDADVATKQKNAVYTYAQRHLGYSEQELSQIGDHRAVNALRKAYLYDELMKQKPAATKKTKSAPKMAKAGQPTSKREISAKRKRQQLSNISKMKGRKSMDAAVQYLLEK
jgi:hypothetical protein